MRRIIDPTNIGNLLDRKVLAVTRMFNESKDKSLAVSKIASFFANTYRVPIKEAQMEAIDLVKLMSKTGEKS